MIVGLLLSIFFLWLAFRGVRFGEVMTHLRQADPVLLSLAVLNHTLGIHVRALRWKYLLAPVIGDVPLRPRVAATAIGIATNNVIPLRVGEFARVLVLARQTGTAVPVVLGTLVLERVLDGLVMVGSIFVVMALPSFPTLPATGMDAGSAARGLLMVAGAIGAALVLLALFPQRALRVAEKVSGGLPDRWRRAVVDSLRAFLQGLAVLHSPGYLTLSVLWALGQWTFLGLGFYLGFLAFGIEAPGIAGALFLQAVVGFAVALPSTPGFFGPWEAASRYALSLWGVADGLAVSFAVAFHTGTYLLMTGVGTYYLWRLGLKWGEVRRSTETVEDEVEADLGPPDRAG